MSLFQDKAEFLAQGDETLDVFHLAPHGCDVMFSQYSEGTSTECQDDSAKILIIDGHVTLHKGDRSIDYHTGDWYEIPASKSYEITFHGDCAVIEFWFRDSLCGDA